MNTRITIQNITLPGHRAPAAGFEEPFEMLTACHERVERMLALLQRLREHLAHTGWDDSAAQAARDVMRYFDQAAPLHHQDEERHVFPVLLATPDTGLHRVVHRLQQDHRDMEAHWARARVVLQRIQQPSTAAWQALSPEEADSLTAFAGLYDAHIEAENQQVYPAVQALLSEQARQNMSADMMARRGVSTQVKR